MPSGRRTLAGYPSSVVPFTAAGICITFITASIVRNRTATPLSTRPVHTCAFVAGYSFTSGKIVVVIAASSSKISFVGIDSGSPRNSSVAKKKSSSERQRQAEQRKERGGVEERVPRAHAVAVEIEHDERPRLIRAVGGEMVVRE